MRGLTDHEAVLADFKAYLVADGRKSHGTDHLTRKLTELEVQHRVDEEVEEAVIRRLCGHIFDAILGLVPKPPVTDAPLGPGDLPEAPVPMDPGADFDPNKTKETHNGRQAAGHSV